MSYNYHDLYLLKGLYADLTADILADILGRLQPGTVREGPKSVEGDSTNLALLGV